MFKLIDEYNPSEAGALVGVRICAGMIGVGATLALLGCALFGFITFMTIKEHDLRGCGKSLFLLLCCLSVAYMLIKVRAGLLLRARFAQLGGIASGVLLLLFCWMLVRDAQGPSDPKAPDAQELNGPMFFVSAPTALWLIGYLSTRRVSEKFLSSQAEK